MEGRVWRRPLTMVQKFEPNEYVAACGDSGVVYNFTCDAGWTETHYIFGIPYEARVGGTVYQETNGVPGLQTGGRNGDRRLTGSYHPCDETHEADSDDGFLNGYLYNADHGQLDVVIWRGPLGNNVHCTTNLDQDSWETAKS